jgi:hypothetical protein
MMSHSKPPVIWRDEVVGTIEDVRVDHLEIYGRWIPSCSDACKTFLEALQSGEQLEVRVGTEEPKLVGTVEIEPDEEIEIRIRPRASSASMTPGPAVSASSARISAGDQAR